MSPEIYEDNIPDCCELRTYEEHANQLMLCWGITSAISRGIPKSNCGICEYNKENRNEVQSTEAS